MIELNIIIGEEGILVSSINSNNYDSNYFRIQNSLYQNNKSKNNIDIDTIELSFNMDILNDYNNLETQSYKFPKSFSEYVDTKKRSILSETIGESARKASELSAEEYQNKKQDYQIKINEFDFENGYKEYLQSVGCQNEEELTNFVSDEEKEYIMQEVERIMTWVAVSNPGLSTCLHDFDNIKNNIKYSDMENFYNFINRESFGSSMIEFKNQCDAVKSVLSSINNIENKDLYINGIDLFYLQTQLANQKGETLDSNKLVDDYFRKLESYIKNGGNAQNFASKYLKEEIETIQKKIIENKNYPYITEELNDSYISTKIIENKIAMYQK